MPRFPLPLAAALAAWAPLSAQGQFDHLPKTHLVATTGSVADLLWYDADADGDRDLLVVGQLSRLLSRTGPRQFASQTSAVPGSIRHRAAAMGDLDGDGDQDLVVARERDEWVFHNQAGALVDVSATAMPFTTDDTRALALGDLDGDGDLDLVCGNADAANSPDRLLWNNGTGRFTAAAAGALPPGSGTVAVQLVDVDGDGDLDLLRGSATAPTELLRNQGGVFTAVAGALPNDGGGTTALLARDLDGDGDADLLVGKASGGCRLFANQGGTFLDASALLPGNLPAPYRLLAIDHDGDGDRDLLWSSRDGLVLLRREPAGFVDRRADVPASVGLCFALTAEDADGDGDLDLVVQSGRLQLLVNAGGVFHDASGARIDFVQPCNRLVDIDRDGDLDLVTAPTADLAAGTVQRNDGTGIFTNVSAQWRPAGALPTQYGLATGDVDRDGDPDLVLGQSGQERLFLNDGTGRFVEATATHLPVTNDPTTSLALADFDGDGDPDLVTGNALQSNRYYRNDGTGRFQLVPQALPQDLFRTLGVVAIDADRDGDLDLVSADANTTSGMQLRLYVNLGGGTFVAAPAGRMPTASGFDGGLAVGDVDGDGDADVVGAGVLAINDGAGTFVDQTAARCPRAPGIEPQLVDLDGDGDLDLIGYLSLLRNDGTGHFVDDSGAFVGSGFGGQVPRPYAVGDVDGDGDVDVVGSYDVFANLQRQLAVRRLPALGGPLEVDFFAARAAAPFAIVFLGSQATALPIPPWGILRVGLPGMLATQGVSIAAASGKATLTGTIPNSAALAGVELYLQALVVDGADLARARFGNLVREVVVP